MGTMPSSRFISAWRKAFDPARILPPATPRMLAFCRITVTAILLISVCWENLPSTVHLPDAMRQRLGIVGLLETISWGAFERLYDSWVGLCVVQVAAGLALLLALLGLWTRWTTALGAVLYLLVGGMLRQYAWFYHTGLVPLYALIVLALTPCGDAWSVDRWQRRRRGQPVPADDLPRLVDAWSVYAVWVVIAVPYVMAGFSKIRAGLDWFHPHSFRTILLVDALQPMHFTFDFTDLILHLPNGLVTALAIAAVAGEIGMGAVLFSARARWIMPAIMVAMHLGIWLLQRVLFFDLILIQILFLVPPRWFAGGNSNAPMSFAAPRWLRPIPVLLVVLAVIWMTRFEWYPLTDMHMYTRVNKTGVVRYPQLVAHLASGQVVPARPEKIIGAMQDARYRRLLGWSKREEGLPVAREFFVKCGQLHNQRHPPPEHITAYEVIWKRWAFTEPAEEATRGKISSRQRFDIAQAGE
jgi:hypothetical protein